MIEARRRSIELLAELHGAQSAAERRALRPVYASEEVLSAKSGQWAVGRLLEATGLLSECNPRHVLRPAVVEENCVVKEAAHVCAAGCP